MHTARSLTVSPSMLCSRGGACLVPGGACLVLGEVWSKGGVCLVRGVPSWYWGEGVPAWSQGLSGPGGCLVLGVPAWSWGVGVWYPSMHWGRSPCEQNHRYLWKYYLAPTSLRAVKTYKFWKTSVLFVRPLIPLFGTPGDVCPGFQSLRASSPESSDSPLAWQ